MSFNGLTPIPYVVIDGNEVNASATDTGPMVLDDLRMRWGRTFYLDYTQPSTLSVRILDEDGTWALGKDFLGLRIVVAIRYNNGTTNYPIFNGRITEASVTSRGLGKGWFVELSASCRLAELGNKIISNVSWPMEDWSPRIDRIWNSAFQVVDGISKAGVAGLNYRAMTVDQKSVLEVITDMYASVGQFVVYRPDTNTIEASGRSYWTGSGPAFVAVKQGGALPNTYTIRLTSSARGSVMYSEDLQPKSGVTRSVGTGITEIRYESYDYNNNKQTSVGTTNLPASRYGYRAYTVSTDLYNMDVSSLVQLYVDNANDANTWQMPQVVWDTRRGHGFGYYDQIHSFIGGYEDRTLWFLQGSQYNIFPNKAPVYRVIGADCTWRTDNGVTGWVIEPYFGPVAFVDPMTPVTWNTINPSTTDVATWEQLRESVIWSDLGVTSTGV